MCYIINHQEPNYLDLTKERLLDLGYSIDTVESLIEKLSRQSFNIQATFYHRMNGFTQYEIAEMLNISQQRVDVYIKNNIKKIKLF